MIIALHTGPKSAPRLALFDTTGIAIVAEDAPAAPKSQYAPESDYWASRPDELAAALAEEAKLHAEIIDRNYRQAAVWHGTRYVYSGGGCDDCATFVHETVEEIAALVRLAGGAA